ncbi:hypothetical protein D3C72_1762720 [compost metagenome]
MTWNAPRITLGQRAHVGREMLGINAVINHRQFIVRQRKAVGNIVAHHLRVANYFVQLRMGKHLRFCLQNIAMIAAQGLRPARQRRQNATVLLKPGGVNTIARAENRRARNALMALHDIELRKLGGGSVSKAGFAGQTVTKRRVYRQRVPAGSVFPLAGNQRHIQRRILRQYVQRAGDKTLRAAVGVIGLSDDRQFHAGESSSSVSMALRTC